MDPLPGLTFGDPLADDEFQLPEIGETLDIGDPLSEAVQDAVRQFISDAADGVGSSIESWNAEIARRQASSRAVSGIQLDAMERNVLNAVRTVLSQAENQGKATIDGILLTTEEVIKQVNQSTAAVSSDVREAISEGISQSVAQSQSLENLINARISEATSVTVASNNELERTLKDAISEQTRQAERSNSQLSGEVTNAVNSTANAVRASNTALSTQIRTGLEETISKVEASNDGLFGSITGLASSLLGGLKDLSSTLASAINGFGESLLGPAWEGLLRTLGVIDEEGRGTLESPADRILRAMDPDTGTALRAWNEIQDEMPVNPVIRGLLSLVVWFVSGPQYLAKLLDKRAEKRLQDYGQIAPWALLPIPDIIDAFKRDLKTIPEVITEIRAQGYTEGDAKIALALRRLIAPVSTLLDWWRKDLIDENKLRSELEAQGYDGNDIQHYIDGAYPPPPLMDIITMSVKEVFSPDARSRLDLDSEYPTMLTRWARQQGLSEEWARNYWAMHWRLPAWGQVATMRHRGLIDDEDVKNFLKAADFSPTWREKLFQVTYQPYTRVDLRRMYANDILTEQELTQGYMDLGYDEIKAANLTRYTIVEREREKAEFSSPFKGLSAAQMREAVHRQLMSRNDAEAELEARGMTPRAADIFLALTTKGTPEDD